MVGFLVIGLALLAGLLYQLLVAPPPTPAAEEAPPPATSPARPSDPASATPAAAGTARGSLGPMGDAGPDAPAARTSVPAARRVQSAAPAAIPSSITQEKDPVKRAKLMKMHRLATARVRVALLDRRRQMLRRALERAKADPTATSTSPREMQRQLARLEQALAAARKRRDALEPPQKAR